MNKIEELIEQLKIYTGLVEKKPAKKECNICAIIITVLAIIGVMVAVGYALYRFFGPSYYDDFEDEYEDDFDDDFFEDEEEDIKIPEKNEEKEEKADEE